MNRLVTLLAFAFYTCPAFACTCAPVPTFCESITWNGSIDSNYLIIHAIVEDKESEWMHVRILDVLFGTPTETIIAIPNGYGADCRMSIAPFNTGDQYIFALYGETYHLSICGVTWLEVDGNQIKGDIAPGINKIRISDFPTIDNCGGIGTMLTSISVYPTLTSHTVGIHTTADLEGVEIRMYDMIGRLILRTPQRTLLVSEPFEIRADDLPSGCYTIALSLAGIRRTFRVVILS